MSGLMMAIVPRLGRSVCIVEPNVLGQPAGCPGALQVIAAIAAFVASQAALASSYYINGSTGSDSNSGSQSAPFKTFSHTMTVLQAGDTAHVASGTYTKGMYITVSGSAGKPITFIGDSTSLPVI